MTPKGGTWTHWRALFSLFFFHSWIFAQVPPDSGRVEQDPTQIEDAISGLETDSQTDWTFFSDQLEDFQKRPLDLNHAAKEDLLLLPGMTEIIANNLISHISRFGELKSIFELQAIPGFSFDLFKKIQPFVTVGAAGVKDMSGIQHPKGPPFASIFRDSKKEILIRDIFDLETEKGYLPPDTTSNGTLSSHYEGNRHRNYLRYRMRYGQNFSAGFVLEKDAGEAFKWNPSQHQYGPDFLSGHFFLRDYGHWKRVAIGDFTAQFGQGLIISSGLGFGKGAEAVNAVKRTDFGIRPFSSVNENQYLRGGAATYALKNWWVTGFASKMNLDASISTANDTLTDDLQAVSSLQTSGLHRTESELRGRRAAGESLIGGRVEYRLRRLKIGTTQLYQHFSYSIQPGTKDYQLFQFSGKNNQLSGLDFDFTWRNFNFFGEGARSANGGTGMILGALGSIDRRVDVAILYRNLSRDFHSTRGFIFGESPTNLQNEKGIYLGAKAYFSPKWTFSGFIDQYAFPWHTYSASYPSKGWETLAQLDFRPNRNTGVYLRYRFENKEKNASEFPENQQLDYLTPGTRNSLRLHFDAKLTREVAIKTRIEKSWWEFESEKATGFVMYQDLSWKTSRWLKLTGRYALFDAQDYNARIYAYENDILGFFSIPAYYGVGSRYYLVMDIEPGHGWEFWIRISRTQYAWDKSNGSGLAEVPGNRRTEIKFQARYSF